MASGWWASLWTWGHPAPQQPGAEASRHPDRVPDDGPRPTRSDARPAPDETAPHRAPAAATHTEVAPPPPEPVHPRTSGPSGRPGSHPDPERSDLLRPPATTT